MYQNQLTGLKDKDYALVALSSSGKSEIVDVIGEASAERNFEPVGRYNRSDGVEPHRFSGACVTPRLQQRNIGARFNGRHKESKHETVSISMYIGIELTLIFVAAIFLFGSHYAARRRGLGSCFC